AVVTHQLMDEVERTIPGIKVGESYGLTEGGSPFREPLDGRAVPRGSPGVQAPEVLVRLVGPDGKEREDEGELWLKSPYNCLGYPVGGSGAERGEGLGPCGLVVSKEGNGGKGEENQNHCPENRTEECAPALRPDNERERNAVEGRGKNQPPAAEERLIILSGC